MKSNPFIRELKGGSIFSRESHVNIDNCDKENFCQYEILGLSDIFMDYAGGFPSNHSIHKRISKLETGSEVFLIDNNQWIEVHDRDKNCVSRLANKASAKWKDRLDIIHEVRVISMITRNHTDPDENFEKWIKADSWELPILEVVCRG